MSPPLRVAISGGGLAGASLLHALLQYKHLDVHIFESAKEFREAGIAIGMSRNALAALDLLGQSQCLEQAGAVPMRGVRFMLAQGKDAGAMIAQADDGNWGDRVTSIVHRAAFLRELLADIPADRMHASKRLDRIDRNGDGSVTMHFTDGSVHECDILVGADGIHSTVRKAILGADDPAISPTNTGWWTVMVLKPYADAQASFGKDLIDIEDAREFGWIGDGSFLLHNVLENGQLVQIATATKDEDAEGSDRWSRTATADELRKIYQDYPPQIKKAVDELLCNEPEQPAIYLWDQPPARSYVSGPICVMGDAAHATTPWQASGGGMSIEDSLILSTLLGRVKTPVEAVAALEAYDQIRRPRTQRIVESSRVTGTILAGKGEDTLLDLGKLKERLLPRWDFIIGLDMAEHRDEAVETLEKLVKKGY
ncbi:Salicylate hydroxylase [Cytospora mali]|uniref:Salicylate hydroxylase n=1 Tax=Cytospora mali TaxID=578113 RepID=A0A194VUL4_CYTMA|nr:Salicylate hydroxylase [Valsa mali]